MSSSINAFPIPGLSHDEEFNGMTLRDYFAAKAMQSFLASDMLLKLSDMVVDSGRDRGEWVSEQAYKFADAMLEARK